MPLIGITLSSLKRRIFTTAYSFIQDAPIEYLTAAMEFKTEK